MRAAKTKILHWTTAAPIPLDRNGPHAVSFRPFELTWVERPALDLFAGIVATHPDNTACEDTDTQLTFAEVWAASLRLATTIDGAVAGGAPVGVLLPNQASYAVAVLACLGAARPCVLIDRNYPPDRVGQVMRDAGLSAIVLRRSDIAEGYLLPAGARPIELDRALEGGATPGRMPAVPPPPDAASFVVYTSGSTGAPKGIVLSQRSVLHRSVELVNAVHLRPDDKVLSLASPGTIGGLQQIFEVMLSGASLVKLDLQRLGLGQILRTVAEQRITMMFSTPAVWRSVARLEGAREQLASLRCIQSSGDTLLRLDYELVRSVVPTDCHVLSVYGATEAPALLQWFASSPPDGEARVPAGYPLPGFDFALLDEKGGVVPDGEVGEFVIRSRFTSLGVWRNGAVLPGPFECDPAEPTLHVYRTGDLARRRPDDLYVVLGRKDRQVKIRGNRVELAEIETILRRLPVVRDAAVVARRATAEPELLAFVVPRLGSQSDIGNEVRDCLVERLPSFMRPQQLFVVDKLPLIPGHKVDEEALLAHAAQRDPAATAPFPSPQVSRWAVDMVRKSWRSTLGRPAPRDNRSFEEAGGDSLRLLQLIFHLERLADKTLPLERFNLRQSATQFARELERCFEGTAWELPGGHLVFLFPPGGGGNAQLAEFRTACAEQMTIRQVSYPDLRSLARREASFADVAAHTVQQIEQAKAEGPLVLAGYSDGGDVAYAAAQQLLAAGRKVALLCIFDTDATGLQYPQPPAQWHPLPDRIGRWLHVLWEGDWPRLLSALLPARLFTKPVARWVVRMLLALRLPLPANVRFLLSLQATMGLLNHHHLAWLERPPPSPLAVPVVLFRSREPRPGAPDDIGWQTRTNNLMIIPVPGDHVSMLGSELHASLRDHFARRVIEAS